MQSLNNDYLKPESAPGALPSAPSAGPVVADASKREISLEVAHDLNNALTIINGYAERLLTKNANNPALRAELQMIFNHGRRAEEIVRQAVRGERKR